LKNGFLWPFPQFASTKDDRMFGADFVLERASRGQKVGPEGFSALPALWGIRCRLIGPRSVARLPSIRYVPTALWSYSTIPLRKCQLHRIPHSCGCTPDSPSSHTC